MVQDRYGGDDDDDQTGNEKSSRKRRRTRSSCDDTDHDRERDHRHHQVVISRFCHTDTTTTTTTNVTDTLEPIHNIVRCCSLLLNRLQPSQQQEHEHHPAVSIDCPRQRHRYNFQQQLPQHHHHHHQQQQQLVHQQQQRHNYNTNRSDVSNGSCVVVATSSSPPPSNCSVLSLVFALVLLLSVVTNTRWPAVMANPVLPTSTVPKWINPCNYDLESRSGESSAGSTSSTDGATGAGVDFQSAEARTLYDQIVSEVESTETYVNEIKHQFVAETFGDPSFIEEFEWISYEWLPKIPAATPDNFDSAEVSLKNSFEYLQHFAVAIEQMTMDQMIYEGSHLDQFRTMEKRLRNVLCLLQGAMLRLRVGANPDVTRGVMSEEYRSIEMDAMRNVRDYIIMREYAHALMFIHQAFGYFQNLQDASDDS